MNNKAIAINTILLLVVGLIVVGVIVYLVYTFTSGPTLSVQDCKTKIIQYCTLCANVGWTGIDTPQTLIDCGNKYPELSVWRDNTDCATGGTKADCEAVGVG
jgi:hypothetical protein